MKNNNEYLEIKKVSITGVNNPMFQLEAILKSKEEMDFEIIVNGEKIEFEILVIRNNEIRLILKTEKIKYSKFIIEVFLIINGQKKLVYTKKNYKIFRFINKLITILNKIVSIIYNIFFTIYKGFRIAWREYHFLIPPTMWKKYFLLIIDKIKNGNRSNCYNPFVKEEYHKWIKENEKVDETIEFEYNPLISVIIPVYNVSRKLLVECLESVLCQTYNNYEICIADDCSTKEETVITLKEYEKLDKVKIVYRTKNGHISQASNSALELAKGEFIALLDNDDVLAPNALYEMVKVLNNNKELDLIYSDEDKLNLNGERCNPNFKPDWSPDTLMSENYICHFTLLRKSIVDDVGGFSIGLEGAQDYDLFLKVTEKTNKIYHIPKILYHWRMVEGSTALSKKYKNYTCEKGKMAIENSLKRRNINAIVKEETTCDYFITEYLYEEEPKISILIPTRDYADTLETCLKSLYERTTYKNFEVLVLNNNSVEKATFNLFNKYKNEYDNFSVIDINTEFNYSNINNVGVKNTTGDYIVLLNNDTEIITPNWLEIMVGYAMQPHIGAVGPKLLYPDDKIQHAGVILGLGGVASHVYIGFDRNDCGMYGRLKVPYNYSAVTAACLMVSKNKFLEVNGLEEDLMVAYNDVDFNIKLLKKGYYNLCVPQVELYHFESKSRGLDTTTEKYRRFISESNYMYDKWYDEINDDKFYNPNYSKKSCFMLNKKDKKDKN